MTICLVRCPSKFLIDERAFPPLGLMAVGAGLRQAGREVVVYDGEIENLPLQHLYYGFGPTAPEYPHALDCAARIRQANPQAHIVLGGPHATLSHHLCREDGWDCIVVGDGELVANRAFSRQTDPIVFAVSKPLDEYPMPDRSLVDIRKYRFTLHDKPATTIMSSRGCPHHCGFCLPRGTLILTADLTWKRIEAVSLGDTLVGVEKKEGGRTLFTGTYVTELFHRKASAIRITTSNGVVVSSPEHPWLTTHDRWIEARHLRVGQYLRNVSTPRETQCESTDYRKGYVVGCIMGDGHLKRHRQKDPHTGKYYIHHVFRLVGDYEMLDWFLKYANQLDINVYPAKFNGGGTWKCDRSVATGKRKDFEKLESLFNTPKSKEFKRGWLAGFYDAEGGWSGSCRFWNTDPKKLQTAEDYLSEQGFVVAQEQQSLRIMGGDAEAIRFMAFANPKVTSKRKQLFSKTLHSKTRILKIEPLSRHVDMFNLETTCHNFIADGFVTHNCCKNQTSVRLLGVPRLIEEIDVLHYDYGYDALAFPEDIFILSRLRTAHVCEHLKKRGIIWRCLVRADLVVKYGQDFLDMMTSSGCVGVGVGVESGSDRILRNIGKGETVATMLQAIRMLQQARVFIKGFFILGLPGENEESLAETERFLRDARLGDIDVKIFQPYPGSPIYDHRERYDIQWDEVPLEYTFYKGAPGEYYGNVRTSALSNERIVEVWKHFEDTYKRWEPAVEGVMCPT